MGHRQVSPRRDVYGIKNTLKVTKGCVKMNGGKEPTEEFELTLKEVYLTIMFHITPIFASLFSTQDCSTELPYRKPVGGSRSASDAENADRRNTPEDSDHVPFPCGVLFWCRVTLVTFALIHELRDRFSVVLQTGISRCSFDATASVLHGLYS